MDPNNTKSNGMATAALVLGILSILFICCGGSVILGALGIMFALLSRGAGAMDTSAKVGLGLSIAGLFLSLIMIVVLVILSVNSSSYGTFMEEFINEYEYDENYNTSDPLEQFLEEYFNGAYEQYAPDPDPGYDGFDVPGSSSDMI